MTDQTIPADQARRARQWARDTLDDVENGANVSAYARDAARTLIAMMPRPTLADMTLDEQDECTGMQADLVQGDRVVILDGTPDSDGLVQVLEKSLDVYRAYPAEVTPRPDLPSLEWPGDKKPAPAPALPDGWRLADHKVYGRVIVTTTEPDGCGDVWFVRPAADHRGFDWLFSDPAELTYIDQGADTSDAVPEGTLAVGSVWDDADALARACEETGRDQIVVADKRGSVGVWDTVMQCWRVSAPHADFAPYTVIRAGRGVDQ